MEEAQRLREKAEQAARLADSLTTTGERQRLQAIAAEMFEQLRLYEESRGADEA